MNKGCYRGDSTRMTEDILDVWSTGDNTRHALTAFALVDNLPVMVARTSIWGIPDE